MTGMTRNRRARLLARDVCLCLRCHHRVLFERHATEEFDAVGRKSPQP
jgi:hypothetical protein